LDFDIMTAFIIVTLASILFLFIVWSWLALRRRSQRHDESYAGKSTISEVAAKERKKD
jgi:hypothetical protein